MPCCGQTSSGWTTPKGTDPCGPKGQGIISTATVADDPVTGTPTVYVNSPDGNLYALNAATGAVVWQRTGGHAVDDRQ